MVERKTEVSSSGTSSVRVSMYFLKTGGQVKESSALSFQLKQQLLNTLLFPRESMQEGVGRDKGSSREKSVRQTSGLVRHRLSHRKEKKKPTTCRKLSCVTIASQGLLSVTAAHSYYS